MDPLYLQKESELKKHVAFIHCSSPSLLQRKITNGLLSNAYDRLLIDDEHHISIGALSKLIGYKSNDYNLIKNTLKKLLSTVCEWNLIDNSDGESAVVWNASSIIADASIKNAVCTYSYSKRMRELLYMPTMYGRLDMAVQAQFKSTYGLALYENCVRYQNIPQTPWIDFSIFRKLMGVPESKYKIFRDFKSRVLNVAVAEVALYSSIQVEPELKHKNRKVTEIRFLIKNKKAVKQQNDNIYLEKTDDQELIKKMISDYGLSRVQCEEVINLYSPEYIQEKINLIQSYSTFQKGKIINLTKYLLSALSNDYQPSTSSAHYLDKKVVKDIESEHISKEQNEISEQKRRMYEQYVLRSSVDVYSELRKVSDNLIIAGFKNHLKGRVLEEFNEAELENVIVAEHFVKFIKKEHAYLLDGILSYKDFHKQREHDNEG